MTFVKAEKEQVRFVSKDMTAEAWSNSATIITTYAVGADNNYLSKAGRVEAHMFILQKSTKRVKTANGGTSTAIYVTPLPLPRLSKVAAEAHKFEDVPTSLLSVGKVNDDGNVSIFMK